MKMKKQPEKKIKPADDTGPQAVPEEIAQKVSGNVCCSYGIHRGNFPVGGMKVKDARTVLKKLMKVDDAAIAVINGQEVDEEETIAAETTMLAFVKPSAKKGAAVAEEIVISDRHAKMGTKSMAVDKFCGLVADHTISGMDQEPIPDNVKWLVKAGQLKTYIIELKPEIRRIKWLKDGNVDSSRDSSYKFRKLATPYVILKASFFRGQFTRRCELFYRNKPLLGLDDNLQYSNLLNVSCGPRVANYMGLKTWVCTQFLNIDGLVTHADVLDELISHIFGGGFNRSSDYNEGESGFSLHEKSAKSDRRIKDADLWEKESDKDPRFVLDVDWLDAGVTPRQLVEFDMTQHQIVSAPTTSKALASVLMSSRALA